MPDLKLPKKMGKKYKDRLEHFILTSKNLVISGAVEIDRLVAQGIDLIDDFPLKNVDKKTFLTEALKQIARFGTNKLSAGENFGDLIDLICEIRKGKLPKSAAKVVSGFFCCGGNRHAKEQELEMLRKKEEDNRKKQEQEDQKRIQHAKTKSEAKELAKSAKNSEITAKEPETVAKSPEYLMSKREKQLLAKKSKKRR